MHNQSLLTIKSLKLGFKNVHASVSKFEMRKSSPSRRWKKLERELHSFPDVNFLMND